MVLTDDWKNNNLCSEGDIKPAVTKLINLQSIYNQCSEGGIISNKNLYYDEEYMLSELKRFYKDTGYIPNTSNMRRYNGEYPTSEMFKIGININDKYKNEFIKNELDLNRCNLDMKLDLYTY